MIKEYNSYPQISVDNFIYKLSKQEFSTDPFLRLLVFEDDNTIKGFLLYSEIYDRLEIDYIYVLEEYRNMGIASKLLEYLFSKYNYSCSLEVRCDNMNAIKLYKKFNFEIITIRKNYYGNVDGYLMVRK